MLGKLMKHEWKSSYKFGSIMVLTIFVLTLIGYFFLSSSAVGDLISGELVLSGMESFTLVMSSVGTLLLYYLALIGAMYGIMIYMGVRFYKTMYTSQGYLTHTLPVKPGQLLASKILVSGIWTLLVYLAVFASIFILLIGLLQGIVGDALQEVSFAELWKQLAVVYGEIGFDMNLFMWVMLGSALVSPFSSVIQIFGALTIGQLSKKHKLMVGIFTYIGLIILNYIITMIAESVIMMKTMFAATGEITLEFMNSSYLLSIGYTVIISIVLVIVSHLIIKKKLNMD